MRIILSQHVTLFKMKYALYKPNSNNSGAAFSFDSTHDKQGKPSLFISMVLQYSWDNKSKNGSFKGNAKDPNKSSTIKISANEAGEIISSFRSRAPYSAFHKTSEKQSVINLTPWDKKRKTRGKDGDVWSEVPAWGLSVIQNSSQFFKLSIEAGEAMVIERLLIDYIDKCLNYTAKLYEKDRQESYQKKQGNPQYQKPQSNSNENKPNYETQNKKSSYDDDVPF